MDVDSMINMEKRLGFGDDDINEFLAKATAVEDAIKGMLDGTVDPASVKIPGIETEEEKRDRERKRDEQLRLDRERRAALEAERKKEERRRWWEGADAMFPVAPSGSGGGSAANAVADDEDLTSMSSRATRMLRYSADYSRWDQWTPSDPATKIDEQERAAEEERRRNEEFERNNKEFCDQYMNDMTQRERLREKQVQSADANRLKGNTYFKAKKYDVALTHYLDALKSQPFDVKVLMNIAQCYLKLEGGQEDAWEFISRVLRIQPNHAKALSRKAFVHTQRGDLEEALKCATKAREIESRNDDIKAQVAEITLLLQTKAEEHELEALKSRLPSVSTSGPKVREEPLVNDAVLQALAANDLTAMESAVEQTVILPAIANAMKTVDDLLIAEQKNPIDEAELILLYSKCADLSSADKNIRLYARTSKALVGAFKRFESLVPGSADFTSNVAKYDELLVAVLSFLTACIREEDGNRLVVTDRKSTSELIEKLLTGESLPVSGRVAAPLLRFINSFTDGSLTTSQAQIFTRKNLVLGIGILIENAVLYLTASQKSTQDITATLDLLSETAVFMRSFMFNPNVKASRDSVVRKETRTTSIVQNLSLSLLALLYKCRGSKVDDLVMRTLEALLGCSQHPELRRVFGDSMRSINFGNNAPTCPTPLHAVALLSSTSHTHGRYVDVCLGILMNICLVDGAANEGDGVDMRDKVFESGCFDSVISTVTATEEVRASLEPIVLVRSAGLLARLSTCAGATTILSSPNIYGRLCTILENNLKVYDQKKAINGADDSKWLLDERSHLIRVIASVSKLPSECLVVAEKRDMVKTLLRIFPEPRKELNEITPSSVILPPPEPASTLVLGNVARCLMPLADDPNNADILYRKASLHGVEKLICAMATCADMRVRKNIAILLAKGARNPETRSKIERFRGMQMLIDMQKEL